MKIKIYLNVPTGPFSMVHGIYINVQAVFEAVSFMQVWLESS